MNIREDKDFPEFHALDTDETEANQEENIQKVDEKFASQEKASACDDNLLISAKDDEWCEVEERPAGVMDTLLQEPNIGQNIDSIISFAPAQGNQPLGIFVDKESEFLSFPTIHCGKRRPDNRDCQVPVHYSTVCKWELRCQDRRVAQSVPNIFYKLKKLQIKRIQDSASISIRKCKTKSKNITAGDLKSQHSIEKLINLDEGLRVLRSVRGSPSYFEKCRKDLFAMIRQLGNPTWFCSLSAEETRWLHLLKILGRIIEKKEYTDDEVRAMKWQKKSQLIQSDPVICAQCFQNMVQIFIADFLKSKLILIGHILDFVY